MFIKLLLIGPGSKEYFPSHIPGRLISKSYPYNRLGDIVDLIQSDMTVIKSESFDEHNLEKYIEKVFRFYGDDYLGFTYNPLEQEVTNYIFETVDTSRPWTITGTNEGGEHLHYFTKDERFVIKDDSINYGVYEKSL